MQDITRHIQDLLEGLVNLRGQQKDILLRNRIENPDQYQKLPKEDLNLFLNLEKQRQAKADYLVKLSGTEDELKILLGQLSRLSQDRADILRKYHLTNPLDLPLQALTRYTHLWEMTEKVGGMVEGVLHSDSVHC